MVLQTMAHWWFEWFCFSQDSPRKGDYHYGVSPQFQTTSSPLAELSSNGWHGLRVYPKAKAILLFVLPTVRFLKLLRYFETIRLLIDPWTGIG